MAEVRTLQEGTLWWVMASGSGNTWGTASAPTSGLFGYVTKMDWTSAMEFKEQIERGVPIHWKAGNKKTIDLNVSFLHTGTHPTAVSGSGASVPMFHIEHKATEGERSTTYTNTGRWIQFYGCPIHSIKWGENKDGNTLDLQLKAIAMGAFTGSGYLTT